MYRTIKDIESEIQKLMEAMDAEVKHLAQLDEQLTEAEVNRAKIEAALIEAEAKAKEATTAAEQAEETRSLAKAELEKAKRKLKNIRR